MSDDIEYRKAWARANAGRMVRRGVVTGYIGAFSEFGEIVISKPGRNLIRSATDLNRIQDRAVEIEKAALRTLHFLAELVPLPGWAPSTERELMACVRGLKAALKGKKS